MKSVLSSVVFLFILSATAFAADENAGRTCVNKTNVVVNVERCLRQEQASVKTPNFFWYELAKTPAQPPKVGTKVSGGKAIPAVKTSTAEASSATEKQRPPAPPSNLRIVREGK